MAEEVKPETKVAFANRKYSNEDKRKMEEEELEQLIAEQKGETTEATEDCAVTLLGRGGEFTTGGVVRRQGG